MIKLGKIAATGALLTGLLGASLAIAPAANAATVNGGWKLSGTNITYIDSHRTNIVTSVADKRIVKLSSGENAYRRYRIVVKSTSGHTYYNHVLSPWRALYMQEALAQHGDLKTTVNTTGSALYTHFTSTTLKKLTSHYQTGNITQMRADNKAYNKEYTLEDSVLYGPAGELFDQVSSWARKNTSATTFANYPNPTTGTRDGYKYVISGNPNASFTVTVYVHSNVWVRHVNYKYNGSYSPYPVGSSNSLEVLGYWKWLDANRF